jgi:hypothetical protein
VPACPSGDGGLGEDKAFGSGEGEWRPEQGEELGGGLTALVHSF